MPSKFEFNKGKMVPYPSGAIVPDRDLGQRPALECIHLGIEFGGLKAVDDFSLTIGKTEIAGLIGPNGAGKTTVFNLLTKVYQPTHGTILLDGEDTSGKSVYQVNRMGIARTFQNIRLFNTMTVEDNVKVGLHNQERYSGFEGVLRLPTYWKHEKAAHERAMELLSIFDMEHLANEQAGSLPYGAQRRLEIVRALATNPKLLLLDEPAAGMNPQETIELTNFIRSYGAGRSAMVIAIDVGKAVLACLLGALVFEPYGLRLEGMTLAGVCVMLGHDFPALQGFRGGKGILSGWFIAWTIDWRIGLLIGVVFFVTYLITKYVSLGSVLASITFAVGFAVFQHDHVYVMAGGIFMGALCVFMHRANILRLIHGEERKTNLFGKGSKS